METIVENNNGLDNGENNRLVEGKEEEAEIEWVVEDDAEEDEKVSLMLVGKLWTNRHVNENALLNTIKNVWQPKHGLEGSNIGKNLFTFQFFHWKDKERVLDGQPWHFDRHALLLSEVNKDEKPSKMQLHTLPIWARLYDLPFKGRGNDSNLQMIASKIGEFMRIEKRGDIEINKSMRVRVILDLRKPLKDKVNIKVRAGVTKTVMVKYKRQPLLCFICGRLGHEDKDCNEHKEDNSPKKNFGTWVNASPWRGGDIKGSDNEQKESASCARKLFVAKPKYKESLKKKENVL